MTEQPTSHDDVDSVLTASGPDHEAARANVERILDLEYVMSHAKLVERVVHVSLRGDLEAEYLDLRTELGDLVDVDGEPLAEGESDAALSEQSRATEINERMLALQRQMRAESFVVKVRGLPDDQFDAFESQHRDKNGVAKDKYDYACRLIVECAYAPTMTIGQVQQLRSKLTKSQFEALFSAAFQACTTGGLDVPKLPSFWRSPTPSESSKS